MSCSQCHRPGHRNSKKKPCTLAPLVPEDRVTKEALVSRWYLQASYERKAIALDEEYGYTTRRYGLPEHISENIIKFVIQNILGDPSCSWGRVVGDLYSNKFNVIECKCFTSEGPTSFGPTQKWNSIYFLDARDWLNNHLIVWEIALPNTHEMWKNIKIKKNQTKEEKGDLGQRPRINWDGLYPQIKDHCKQVYSGTFEGIFVAVPP